MKPKNTYTLQSVSNALRVLDAFNEEEKELGVSELSRKLGLGRSTVFRLVSTLETHKFLIQNPDTAKYRLGLKILHLGRLVMMQLDLVKLAHPFLEELVEKSEETAHLAILEDNKTFFLDKVECRRVIKMGSDIGTGMPAYCTATGKMLLSLKDEAELEAYLNEHELRRFTEHTITDPETLKKHLAQVKRQGYAVDRGEIEEGLMCIAAPIRNGSGHIVAAISISGAFSRMEREEEAKRTIVLEFGQRISQALGWNPAP